MTKYKEEDVQGVDHGQMEGNASSHISYEDRTKLEYDKGNFSRDAQGDSLLMRKYWDDPNIPQQEKIDMITAIDKRKAEYVRRNKYVNPIATEKEHVGGYFREKHDDIMEDRSNRNNAIIMEIDNSIDPMDSKKVMEAQKYFNKYVYQDDVLAVDGSWGNKTQEAFEQWKVIKKYANLWSAGTDIEELGNIYEINQSKKSDFEKQLELDERVKELNSRIPQ